MWTGSICDIEIARKAGGSAIMANTLLGLGTSDLLTVAAAQLAADAAVVASTRSICDRPLGRQCARGFEVASAMGGTFASTFAVLEASLPDSTGHLRQMITG